MKNLSTLILSLMVMCMGWCHVTQAQVVSIATARATANNDTVTVRGVVTTAQGRFAYLQDSTAGIVAFNNSGDFRDSIASGFVAVGDSFEIRGVLKEFNNLKEFDPILTFTRLNRGNPLPKYQIVTPAEILTNGEDYESELIRVVGLNFVDSPQPNWFTSENYRVAVGMDTIVLRTPSGSDDPVIDGTPLPTSPFIFEGVLGEFNGTYQLIPWVPADAYVPFSLAVGHNNDAESQLVFANDNNTDFGGAARFKSAVDTLREQAADSNYAFVMVTSGDNILPGPEFNASLERDPASPIYDAVFVDSVGYDALCIGNHDFDFGPEILARFISDISVSMPPFLSANLDFSPEPSLAALASTGRIAASTMVEKNGQKIGIIGATTPNLGFISSPGDVVVGQDVAAAVQAEVATLKDSGAGVIILISHLQGIEEDTTLLKSLNGVSIVIAGGGGELLGNAASTYVPGETPRGPYPTIVQDASGCDVPVVTTAGDLKYVGYMAGAYSLRGEFLGTAADARVVAVDSTLFGEDPGVQANVVDSVAAYLLGIDTTILAVTEVALDGVRGNVRGRETNEGNLIADAFLWQGRRLAADFGAPAPDIAMANGGGIRNDEVIPANSEISIRKTFDISPFGNVVFIVEDITPTQFKEVMENAVSRVDTGSGTGRFGQIAGFKIVYDIDGTRQLTDRTTGVITQVGTRVKTITLDDGRPIVKEGQVLADAPTLTLAIPGFLANGGDQYPLLGNKNTSLQKSDQQSVAEYLIFALDSLVTAAEYPEGGNGRIFRRPFDPDSVITVEQARLFPMGDTVTTMGVVTRAKGRLIHIQNESFAMSTFTFGGELRDSTESGFIRKGDMLKIKGERDDFSQLQQLNPVVEFSVESRDNPLPAYQTVSLADLQGNMGETFESELVRVYNLQFENQAPGAWNSSTSYDLIDFSDTLELRTPGSSDTDIPTQAVPTGAFTYEGVANDRFGVYRPFPIDSTDIIPGFAMAILHNNDAESQLIDAGSSASAFGGAARFKAVVDRTRAEAAANNLYSVTVTSGDNILPGPEFNASLDRDPSLPIYDAVFVDSVGYDALCLGNHDFDFGPEILADFIEDVSGTMPPFLSANLDFSGEPDLAALETAGRIAKSVVVTRGGEQIGIVGATTPNLSFISSPRNVSVGQEVADSVQKQVDLLTAQGINKIIVISHLQGTREDSILITQLSDVDVVIAGGGDELLANPNALLLPGDTSQGPYPLTDVQDMDGNTIPVVTTAGSLKYLGQLVVVFDDAGNVELIGEDSNPIRISTVAPDAVTPDSVLQADVVDSLEVYIEGLANNILAITEVDLDGQRSGVRSRETNQGNLIADAFLTKAQELASTFNAPSPTVAFANGGGIRNDEIIPANSQISELKTFEISPFGNVLTVVDSITPTQFKEVMENAVSRYRVPNAEGTGRFPQVAGFTYVVDTTGTPEVRTRAGDVTTPGTLIRCIILDDSTQIVRDGEVVAGAPTIALATTNFTAAGGDQYPIADNPRTLLGISDQGSVADYLVGPLNGVVTAAQYPAGGEGRFTEADNMLSCAALVSVDNAGPQAIAFEAYPNPTRAELNLRYTLTQPAQVELKVYSIVGAEVANLVSGREVAGQQAVVWEPGTLPAGVYFIKLSVDGQVSTKRVNIVH